MSPKELSAVSYQLSGKKNPWFARPKEGLAKPWGTRFIPLIEQHDECSTLSVWLVYGSGV
jgi:hypothetical protein